METRIITTAVIKHKKKYLIAKRAASKKFAPNKWEFISGFVDTPETAEKIILRELKEELSVKGKIAKMAEPYSITDKEARWITLPYLIEVSNSGFTINKKDHSEVKWVELKDLAKYNDLKKDIQEMKKRGMF